MSDERVSAALDELLDRALRGEALDLEAYLAARPDLDEPEKARLRERAHLLAGRSETNSRPVAPAFALERLGDFRILRRLGEGGMGVVFLAEQVSLGRLVALKVMRPELCSSEDAQRRFEREAQAIAQLRHPGIVAVHAAGEASGLHYLAMELAPGQSLDELLRGAQDRGESVSPARAVRWARDVARALECAHAAGVIHRDVKPSNVRIGPDDHALLLDFGLAHLDAASTLSVPGSFHGTPYYASPEQVETGSARVDARTDVYSLGATLYQAVTGRPPFEGQSSAQVFQQILLREPVPPRRLQPAITRDLETVVLKAMEKSREQRYASARAFADDLEALVEMRPVRARRQGPLGRTAKWTRRQPALAAALALIVVSVLGSALFFPLRAAAARRNEARRALGTAEQLAREYDGIHAALAPLREKVRALEASVLAGAPPDDERKRGLYLARDELERLTREREGLVGRADREFASARTIAELPEIERAHVEFIARLYLDAERDGDELARLRLVPRLTGTHREDLLRASGQLVLDSDPSGARVTALRFRRELGGRLVVETERALELGKTPLAGTELEAGSYLLILHAQDKRDTRYPVVIERDRTWSAKNSSPVPLFSDDEIGGEEWIYVPAGWTVLGPDPANERNWPRRVEWIDAFLLSRFEVTCAEYARFLDDPRSTAFADPAWGAPQSLDELIPRMPDGALWRRSENGQWTFDVHAGFDLEQQWRLPVFGISWRNASQFAAWTAARASRSIRLPSESEWERATRGCDGRTFPWGDVFDPSFCATPQAMEARFGKESWGWFCPVGTFELDESCFGVRDLAGSMCEWTASPRDPSAPPESGFRILRGGSLGHTEEVVFHASSRMAADPRFVDEPLGVRLACDLPRR